MITLVTRGISSTIGLAREKHLDHKERKAALAGRDRPEGSSSRTESLDGPTRANEERSHSTASLAQGVQEQDHETEPELTIEQLVETTMSSQIPHNASSEPAAKLAYPVIIPQRRPGSKSRGFVRAYPPDLARFGIDQEAFLHFLKSFHTASQASPALYALSVAASATSPIHGTITMAVSLSVGVALGVAIEFQGRYRANAFLDRMNKELFMPRGLYAMVLIYKPSARSETPDSPEVGIETIDMQTAKQISRWGVPKTDFQNSSSSASSTSSQDARRTEDIVRPFRDASGKTKGEAMMPVEVAPLIYPDLDRTLGTEDSEQETLKQRIKRNKKFVSEYYDRRQTAEFAGNHINTVLASTSPNKPFRSRFADPNHPANNGSITALVTGGKFGHAQPGAIGWRETGDDGRLKPVNKAEDAKVKLKDIAGPISLVSYGIGLGLKGVEKVVFGSNDVMYLTVVNMPTEDELAAARKVIKENRKGIADLLRSFTT